ncbi:MAG: helix-turn-helix domain-containing protein [Methyloprofundus sp.]|nr:helix-turn-helix domain-containing protein [Methyloprofundus sp.]
MSGDSLQAQLKEMRVATGLSAREAASLVDVSTVTWQRWEGQSSRATTIPFACWELFLLKVGRHPTHIMTEQ